MKLVYTATQQLVQIGDIVTIGARRYKVDHFARPHKPASEGKVSLIPATNPNAQARELYVSTIGAEWIEREDRAPADDYEARVRAYEAEGMSRSDAQGVVDAEDLGSF